MATPFRTRGAALPAALRPFRTRQAVRVLVLAGDLALLFNDRDPGLPGSSWWVLPGGGIDEGESPREAARRELAEESGYEVADGDLLGPVATRVALHGYSDQVTEQAEEIFLVRVAAPYAVDVSGQTEFEKLSVAGYAWRQPTDPVPEPVWPADMARLVELAAHPEAWPVDLGTVEESLVPLALGHL